LEFGLGIFDSNLAGWAAGLDNNAPLVWLCGIMREKITTFLLGALGWVCVLAFAALYFFGIYRTFDRYGSVYGFAAIAVPPYAAYRCAAVFWEQPKWKADYAGAAETIATVILSDKSKDGANAAGLVKVERTLREFLIQLPADEIGKLRTASNGLLEAMVPSSWVQWLDLTGRGNSAKYTADLTQAESKIAVVPEFEKVWRRYKEDMINTAKMQMLQAGVDMPTLKGLPVAQQEKMDQAMTGMALS
jgi:hypothetical protein